MKRTIIPVILFLALIVSSCSSIVEGVFEEELKGTWEAYQMIDIMTNDTITDPTFGFNSILNNKSSDSFTLNNDGNFNTYYQSGANTSGSTSGTWNSDFTFVTFNFDDGSKVERTVSINEDQLTMPDTLLGRAKIVTYLKIN